MALDNGLIGAHTTGDIIGLHSEDLLQSIAGAVSLQGPNLHLAEALAAELGLAAQRLLGDQGVGAGGAGVDLVIHQMVQLQEVHIAHGDLIVKAFTGAAVIEPALALRIQARLIQCGSDVLIGGTIENRSGHLPAQGLGSVAQMNLQHLADVHTGGNAQGVQHDVQGVPSGRKGISSWGRTRETTPLLP